MDYNLWLVLTLASFAGCAYFIRNFDWIPTFSVLIIWALIAGSVGVFVVVPAMQPVTQTDVFRVSEKAEIGDALYLIGEGERWYQIDSPVQYHRIQPGMDVQVEAEYSRECVDRWSCNENPPKIKKVEWYGA